MSITKVFLDKEKLAILYKSGGINLIIRQLRKECITSSADVSCLIDMPCTGEKNIEALETQVKALIKE